MRPKRFSRPWAGANNSAAQHRTPFTTRRKALKQVQDQVADVGSRLAQTGERAITLLAEQQRQQEMVAKLESESTAAEQRLRECELSGQVAVGATGRHPAGHPQNLRRRGQPAAGATEKR